jgi:hypothetical protein
MCPSMRKFYGFFCNVRQIFCSWHIFLIKKHFSVISSVFDKTRQKQKSKNINRTLQHLETSEVWLECRESRKNVTCVRSFYPIYTWKSSIAVTVINFFSLFFLSIVTALIFPFFLKEGRRILF